MTSTLTVGAKDCVFERQSHITVLRFLPTHLSCEAKEQFLRFCGEEIKTGPQFLIIDLSAAIRAEDFGSDYPEVATRVLHALQRTSPATRLAICLPETRLELFQSHRLDKLMFVSASMEQALRDVERWPVLAPQRKRQEEPVKQMPRTFICTHCGAVNVLA